MSRAVQQQSKEFRTYTVESRGKDKDVRVPQFPKNLTGNELLRAVGQSAKQAAGEDLNRVVPIMREWIKADFHLRERITWPMLELAMHDVADSIISATRKQTRMAVSEPSATLKEGWRKMKESVMDHPIRFGIGKWVRLKDCTKEQLLIAAEGREKSAATQVADADWFRRIAKQLQPKQKVKDALKEADVERFRDQAHKDVA